MRPSVSYGNEKIEYLLVRNNRLRAKVRIHVHPSGLVEVEAPTDEPVAGVASAVRRRGRWVVRQLSELKKHRSDALSREYISGETHFYLGRRYQLKVVQSRNEPGSVSLKGGQIRVVVGDVNAATVRSLLNNWYQRRAQDYLSRRLVEVAQNISWLKSTPPLKLGAMRKQWGSCSPRGAINLNPWLIRAPRECIDYVILHEVCHLREHNHSKRYYDLLSRHLPDWRLIKRKLDGMAELLLAT